MAPFPMQPICGEFDEDGHSARELRQGTSIALLRMVNEDLENLLSTVKI